MESRSLHLGPVEVSGAPPWDTAQSPKSSDHVVLERSHFESLLRRANFELSTNVKLVADDIIILSRKAYNQRLLMEGKYYRLCRALLAGGVTPHQLAALVAEDDPANKDRTPSPCDVNLPTSLTEKRTVFFGNLSDKTTYADLINIIRGGPLANIHLRPEQRYATASFIAGASEFMLYAKRNDFYLHQKRVEIRWNERQFETTTHLAGRVRRGATRNLVIYNGHPHLDEATIRSDMEHIYNLAIISVAVRGSNIYVSTNSIHHATVARACMTSRHLYRGLKFGWYPDECANPLPGPRKPSSQMSDRSAAKKTPAEIAYMVNRFGLLSCDGDDDGSRDLDDDLYDEVEFFDGDEPHWGIEVGRRLPS